VLQPHAHLQEEEASQAFVVPGAGPVQTMGSLDEARQGLVGNLRRKKDRAGGKTGWLLSSTGPTLLPRAPREHQLLREAVGEVADQVLDAAVSPKGALHHPAGAARLGDLPGEKGHSSLHGDGAVGGLVLGQAIASAQGHQPWSDPRMVLGSPRTLPRH